MDHIISRGDTPRFRIQVRDYLGAVVNVAGWTITLSAAKKRGGVIGFARVGTILDAENGIVSFQLTADDTVEPGTFFYDIQGAYDSNIYTIDSGTIEIIPDVTNASVDVLSATSFRIYGQAT